MRAATNQRALFMFDVHATAKRPMMLEAIFARIRRLLLTPKDEWNAIERESADTAELYKTHVIPLALIPAIATFIGTSIVGDAFFGAVLRVPITSGLAGMIVGFTLTLASVYAMAHIISWLAPKFGAEADFNQALKVSAYFPTAAWLAGAFAAIPAIAILSHGALQWRQHSGASL